MSAKIYDAYRLPAGTDVFDVIAPLRAAILPTRLAADAQAICDRAVSLVDDYSLHRDVDRMPAKRERSGESTTLYHPNLPWLSTIYILAEDERWESPSSTFHDEHRFSITLLRDPADGRLLAIAYMGSAEQIRTAFETFTREHGWSDWHYQSQTDRPEEISDEEWAERRKSWDRTLGDSAPVEKSVSIDIVPSMSYGTSPTVLGFTDEEDEAIETCTLPSPARRLERMLGNAIAFVMSQDTSEKQDVLGTVMHGHRIAGRARKNSHDQFTALLSKMHDLTVEDLHTRSYKTDEAVLGHAISEIEIHDVAAQLIADTERP